ncbi:MAG: NADH-quinone oxidoreductase subunit C [Chloroflexales bacterium]|nr:NADH-quinone oxidoreductase subunit C [Chloroflexales bacterium]
MTYDIYGDEGIEWQNDNQSSCALNNLLATLGAQFTMFPTADPRLRVSREALSHLASELRDRYAALPELIIGADTRQQSGDFTLTYLFGLPRSTLYIIADVAIPAADPVFPSLAHHSCLAAWYEREVYDLLGLVPSQHPQLERLILPPCWPCSLYPLRKDAGLSVLMTDETGDVYQRSESATVARSLVVGPLQYEMDGPVQLHISIAGETITHLELQSAFTHRGLEQHFEQLPLRRSVALAECSVGDASVAHALAYCQTLETVAGVTVPPKAALVRVALLEIERIANHIAGVGAICAAAGFSLAQTQTLRLYEAILRLNERLAGHRLLRGMVIPGGVARDLSPEMFAELRTKLRQTREGFESVLSLILNNRQLLARIRTSGILTTADARALQTVGVVARASGIDADVRRDRPFAAYADLEFRVPVYQDGDTWARMMVRVDEVGQSLLLIEQVLSRLKPGAIQTPLLDHLPAYSSALGLVESWRGPVLYWVVTGHENSIFRCKIKEPSFVNWRTLCVAAQGQRLADFIPCLQSFGLSIAGHDL